MWTDQVCFLAIKDVDAFEKYDSTYGLGKCVCIEGGVVIRSDMKFKYKEVIRKFQER